MKFSIIITGWNAEPYVERAVLGAFTQSKNAHEVIAVDDGSEDGTWEALVKHARPRFFDFSFEKNRGTYYARDFAIREIATGDIIVLLDMDDCLLPDALQLVAEKYEAGCLMTYGNWVNQDGEKCQLDLDYPDHIHASRDYRSDLFRCTHPRSFRKDLYLAIPKWELTRSERESYPDAEVLFSMMEMAGRERIGVISEPIYLYNETNPHRTLKRFGKDDPGYLEITRRPKRPPL